MWITLNSGQIYSSIVSHHLFFQCYNVDSKWTQSIGFEMSYTFFVWITLFFVWTQSICVDYTFFFEWWVTQAYSEFWIHDLTPHPFLWEEELSFDLSWSPLSKFWYELDLYLQLQIKWLQCCFDSFEFLICFQNGLCITYKGIVYIGIFGFIYRRN